MWTGQTSYVMSAFKSGTAVAFNQGRVDSYTIIFLYTLKKKKKKVEMPKLG